MAGGAGARYQVAIACEVPDQTPLPDVAVLSQREVAAPPGR